MTFDVKSTVSKDELTKIISDVVGHQMNANSTYKEVPQAHLIMQSTVFSTLMVLHRLGIVDLPLE